MKSKFASYLENFMSENKYTLDYISVLTNSSLSVIGHYRKGIRIPKDNFIETFISVFKIEPLEAEKIRYMVAYDRTPELIKNELDKNKQDKKERKIISLPMLGKAAAGFGYINFEEGERLKEISVMSENGIPLDSYLVEVSGDSMYPTLLEGDIVLVNPNYSSLSALNGKICILNYHEQTYIKRVKLKENEVRLISDNIDKNQYPDIVIGEEEIEFLVCNGVVIESRREH